jgi:hypothetical protein
MSANAEFSTTLDYEFVGDGIVFVVGQSSNSLDYLFNSSVKNLIKAESSNNFLGFEFSANIQLPTIIASANLSFDFSFSSTAEFGVQRRLTANTRVEFTQSAEGNLPVRASLSYPFEFSVQSSATQFSLGTANLSLDFSVDSNALNYSLHVYDRIGKNEVELVTYEFNGIEILNENNFVEITDSGRNEAKILYY